METCDAAILTDSSGRDSAGGEEDDREDTQISQDEIALEARSEQLIEKDPEEDSIPDNGSRIDEVDDIMTEDEGDVIEKDEFIETVVRAEVQKDKRDGMCTAIDSMQVIDGDKYQNQARTDDETEKKMQPHNNCKETTEQRVIISDHNTTTAADTTATTDIITPDSPAANINPTDEVCYFLVSFAFFNHVIYSYYVIIIIVF